MSDLRVSRRHFTAAAAAAALGAAIPLAGCDKKSDPNSASSSAKLSKVRMQSPWINDAEFIGYFIAMDEGMYQQGGLDFTYLPGGPDKVADIVLASKNAEIALTNPETTVNMILKEKVPFKIIGAQYQKSPLGIVSLAQNKISNPKDLIGRKVAVPDANLITLDAFLKLNGIDPKIFPKGFYYYDQISVSTIYPKSGPSRGDAIIKVYGSGFRADFPATGTLKSSGELQTIVL